MQHLVLCLWAVNILSVRVAKCHTVVSTDELGPNGIPVIPNAGFIVCHVQIP